MTGWGRKESLLQGDVHYWGVWWGMEPFEVYEQKIGRFHSEHGFQGIPAMNSLQKFIPEDERKEGAAAMKTHQKHPTGYETIREYMARDYPVPEDFEDYVYVSQLLQARGISMATRAHRLNRPYTMGSLYWQLNDVWPVTSWSSIDYYGSPKALQYALKQDFAPLMLGVKEQGEQKLQVWVASDMLQDKALRLQVEEFDFSGELIYGKQEPLQVKALESLPYLELALSTSFRQGKSFYHFALVEDDQAVQEFFHFHGRPKDLPLEEGRITTQWISNQELEVQVQDAFQKDLYLEAGGITFDRNYFDALPGTYRLKVVTNSEKEQRPEVGIKTLNALLSKD
jgi:beta-mannosidase